MHLSGFCWLLAAFGITRLISISALQQFLYKPRQEVGVPSPERRPTRPAPGQSTSLLSAGSTLLHCPVFRFAHFLSPHHPALCLHTQLSSSLRP